MRQGGPRQPEVARPSSDLALYFAKLESTHACWRAAAPFGWGPRGGAHTAAMAISISSRLRPLVSTTDRWMKATQAKHTTEKNR